MKVRPLPPVPAGNRRIFLRRCAAAAAGVGLLGTRAWLPNAAASTGTALTFALIGCGRRGTEIAERLLAMPEGPRLTALADFFEENIEPCLDRLASRFGSRVDVPPHRRFHDFDGAREAVAAADAVVFATPPGFRPMELEEAVARGKHAYLEAPMGTDAPGIRRLLAAAVKARDAGLTMATGLTRRADPRAMAFVEHLRQGAIGRIPGMRTYGLLPPAPLAVRTARDTEMTYQIRNWHHFAWLSGDQIVESHADSLDFLNWVKNAHPIRCWGNGGRQVLTPKEYGEVFDHFHLEYEYPDGSRAFSSCRRTPGCWNHIDEVWMGTTGTAGGTPLRIQATPSWTAPVPSQDTLVASLARWFFAIRDHQPFGDVESAAEASMTGILGRLATYSGKVLDWQTAFDSNRNLFPPLLHATALPRVLPRGDGTYPIPVPGVSIVV